MQWCIEDEAREKGDISKRKRETRTERRLERTTKGAEQNHIESPAVLTPARQTLGLAPDVAQSHLLFALCSVTRHATFMFDSFFKVRSLCSRASTAYALPKFVLETFCET